jgi:uncharacterized membrane protein YcaP (DUF421 family)
MPDWLEVALRTISAVLVLFILTKILGKRQISQLSLFEYITGITIGSIAAYVSLEVRESWLLGVTSLVVWAAVSLLMEFLTMKSKLFRDWIDGKGSVLIKDGKIMEDNVKKSRLTVDELLEQLRKKDVFLVADVEFAVLESSGELNVLLKRENQPLTAKHLGIQVAPEPEPATIIIDGEIMDEPLATRGFNRQWLHTELEKIGVTSDNVFVAQVDAVGQLYVDTYNDQWQVPEPQQKQLLYAQLKSIEANLQLFALATSDEHAKQMYSSCVDQMNRVLKQLKPMLIH